MYNVLWTIFFFFFLESTLLLLNYTIANITAIMLEYPLYGNFLAFLICKRLGRISNNNKGWAGLDYQSQEDSVLRALPDEDRLYLSNLLDDWNVRSRPFKAALNVGLSELDLLLFAVQIANGMQFLNESGVSLFVLCIHMCVQCMDMCIYICVH